MAIRFSWVLLDHLLKTQQFGTVDTIDFDNLTLFFHFSILIVSRVSYVLVRILISILRSPLLTSSLVKSVEPSNGLRFSLL